MNGQFSQGKKKGKRRKLSPGIKASEAAAAPKKSMFGGAVAGPKNRFASMFERGLDTLKNNCVLVAEQRLGPMDMECPLCPDGQLSIGAEIKDLASIVHIATGIGQNCPEQEQDHYNYCHIGTRAELLQMPHTHRSRPISKPSDHHMEKKVRDSIHSSPLTKIHQNGQT